MKQCSVQKLQWKCFVREQVKEAQSKRKNVKHNYSYYPVVFEDESTCIQIRDALNGASIYPRRYFFPSLNRLPYVSQVEMPVAENISKRVLCLPLSSDLSLKDVEMISTTIKTTLD